MQPTRRSYSKSFKAQVIQECAQPGASIASIALSHSLNANLVHKWIRVQAHRSTVLQPAFIPLPIPLAGVSSLATSSARRIEGSIIGSAEHGGIHGHRRRPSRPFGCGRVAG
ncbi:transposase [Pseudomonas syringae]|uniref:transposase n=1 Tax=Pseudomonas syringae TaxID=317 RepID=UPI000CD2BBE6